MKRLPLFDAICLSTSTICGCILIVFAITGCKFFGADPAPPTAVERRFFDFETNLVPRVLLERVPVFFTNHVTVFHTNEVGVIVSIPVPVVVPSFGLVTVTQQVEEVTWKPKESTTQTAQLVGTGANILLPGSGGLVTGLISAGLIGWAKLRSRKKTGNTLVQNIESILEFVETVPNGSEYTSAIKNILRKDQEAEGEREKIKVVMKEGVDSSDAKSSAGDMQKSLTNATAATVKTIV